MKFDKDKCIDHFIYILVERLWENYRICESFNFEHCENQKKSIKNCIELIVLLSDLKNFRAYERPKEDNFSDFELLNKINLRDFV